MEYQAHISPLEFNQNLLAWYDKHGRKNLPWQQDISAYRVWISEVMLQQTQVQTVIPYFEKFMHHFPSIQKLSQASQDDVLTHWSGLGYYSRARNIHKAANIIMEKHQGVFPSNLNEIMALPGIGQSTASAITSIVHEQPTPILDGNVKRVLTRFFMIEGWPEATAVKKLLWKVADHCMPNQRCRDYTQAIMDLGALICTRSKPSCQLCPLSTQCLAHRNDLVSHIPHKKPKKQIPVKSATFLILSNSNQQVFLEKRPSQGIWGGLWCLPHVDNDSQIPYLLKSNNLCAITKPEQALVFRHTFSHFHLDITVLHIEVKQSSPHLSETTCLSWIQQEQLEQLGLASPIRKTLQHFFQAA